MLKISESELEPGSERPVYPTIIKTIEVDENPFPDIVPRITAAEKRAQEKARREARKAAASRGKKKQGVKNKTLLSFGEEAETEVNGGVRAEKIRSAHDVLVGDRNLSREVVEARGLPAEMPNGMGRGLERAEKKRKAEAFDEVDLQFILTAGPADRCVCGIGPSLETVDVTAFDGLLSLFFPSSKGRRRRPV